MFWGMLPSLFSPPALLQFWMELSTRITSVASYLTSQPLSLDSTVSYQHSTQSDSFRTYARSCHSSAPNLAKAPILLGVKAQALTMSCSVNLTWVSPIIISLTSLGILPYSLSFSHTGHLLFLNTPEILPLPAVFFSQICPYGPHLPSANFCSTLWMKPNLTTLFNISLCILILPRTPNCPYLPISLIAFYHSRELIYSIYCLSSSKKEKLYVYFVHWFPGIQNTLDKYLLNEYSLFTENVIRIFNNPF